MVSFKEKMRSKSALLGVAIETPEPDVAEIMGTIGFDWFWIDMEHCPLDFKDVQTILQAMGKSEAATLVRVPWNDPVYIKRALDLGPTGVIIPWVNNEDEARRAVMACKYPPEGIRGCGPRRPVWHQDFTKYVREANENVVVVVQIETSDAIKNIRKIISVPGVDGTIIGPADLSASLGHLGNPNEPEVLDAIRVVVEAHRGTPVCPGIASSPENAEKHLEMGFRLVNVGSDMEFMRKAAIETLKRLGNYLKSSK
ncbi:MAG: aldolase/citrate lyase family protein [Thermoproteota archaeon]